MPHSVPVMLTGMEVGVQMLFPYLISMPPPLIQILRKGSKPQCSLPAPPILSLEQPHYFQPQNKQLILSCPLSQTREDTGRATETQPVNAQLCLASSHAGWPLLLALTGVPALIQLLSLPFFPESPRYTLIQRGDEDTARQGTEDTAGAHTIVKQGGHLPCKRLIKVKSLASHMVCQTLSGVIPELRARSNS